MVFLDFYQIGLTVKSVLRPVTILARNCCAVHVLHEKMITIYLRDLFLDFIKRQTLNLLLFIISKKQT